MNHTNVLLIDDKCAEMIDFREQALIFGFKIDYYFTNVQEAMAKLKEDKYFFEGIILDARFFLTPDQAKGKENEGALREAINQIKEIEREQNRFYPKCVYSAYTGKLGHGWETDIPQFQKGEPSSTQKLFEYLQEKIKNQDIANIKRKYPQIYQLFEEELLDQECKTVFCDIATKYENDKFDNPTDDELKGYLASIRSIQEAIYQTIGKHFDDILPQDYFGTNGKVNFNNTNKKLSGSLDPNNDYKATAPEYQNQAIEYGAKFLYWSSGGGIHHQLERSYKMGSAGLKSLYWFLIEQLHWYRDLLMKEGVLKT